MVDDSIEISGIPPGKYVLAVRSYLPVTSTQSMVVNIATDMDLDADAAAAPSPIRGTIRMEGGLTLRPQAFVRLLNSHTDEILDTQVAQNGEFSCKPNFVAPGNYSVFVMNGPVFHHRQTISDRRKDYWAEHSNLRFYAHPAEHRTAANCI